MRAFGFSVWERWYQEGCTLLPAVTVCLDEALPESWEGFPDQPATVLLESAQTGRYSYLCDRPERLIVGEAASAEFWSGDGSVLLHRQSGKPLEILQAALGELKAPVVSGWPAMLGGLIGVFGYDLVRTWERLPRHAQRDLALPLYAFIEPRELFIYDHQERSLGIVVWSRITGGRALVESYEHARESCDSALVRWRQGGGNRTPARPRASAPRPVPPAHDPDAFRRAVSVAQDYIAAGDTYQVNLSLRASRPIGIAPERVYEALRRVNPSPYMGLLRLPAFTLVCGSPELLVRFEDRRVTSRPIAGTRPRGAAEGRDRELSVELLASDKERAEHLMLVDLIRNDIGRVAEFGSVEVQEFMAVERYSHVMHIVSQVEGTAAAGRTWADVLRSMFPGGTITGCPKIRTMEIIEELEPVGRGFYTGALGWISYGGAMEMNIVIRSMLVQDGVAHVQAGAGIVADSSPDRELDEALRKAQALWVALDVATKTHG